jgi:hypothetical protein
MIVLAEPVRNKVFFEQLHAQNQQSSGFYARWQSMSKPADLASSNACNQDAEHGRRLFVVAEDTSIRRVSCSPSALSWPTMRKRVV